jgi:drug/metabolite transporter (DMT)-like permease
MTSLSPYRAGVLFIVLSSLAYGVLPVTLRTIYQNSDLQPTDVAIWRYILAVPLIWIATAIQKSQPSQPAKPKAAPGYRVPLKHLFILGFMYGVSVLLAFFGLERLPVGVFLLLFYTYPAMVAVVSLFFGQSLSRMGWIALGLTMMGAVLTISNTGSDRAIDPLGVGLALAHAVSVVVFFISAGQLMKQSRETTRNTAWQLTATLIFLAAFIPVFGFKVPTNVTTWVGLFVLAGICTSLPIFALNAGIQRIGPAQAAIIGTLEPVVGIFTAFLFLHEPVGSVQLIGTLLIMSAVILLQRFPGKATAQPRLAHEI